MGDVPKYGTAFVQRRSHEDAIETFRAFNRLAARKITLEQVRGDRTEWHISGEFYAEILGVDE